MSKEKKDYEKKIPKLRNFDFKLTANKATGRNTVRTQNNETDEVIDDENDNNYGIVCFDDLKSSRKYTNLCNQQCKDCHKWANSSCDKNDSAFVTDNYRTHRNSYSKININLS